MPLLSCMFLKQPPRQTFLFVRKRGGPDYPESKCCGKHPVRAWPRCQYAMIAIHVLEMTDVEGARACYRS